MRADLKKAVELALKRNRDNPKRASAYLARTARGELRDRLIKLGSDQITRTHFGDLRSSAMTLAASKVRAGLDNRELSERATHRIARQAFWDMYTLYGMQSIASATRDDLIASAESREAQALTELRYAKFERAVAAKIKSPDAQVRNAMTLADVEKLAAKFKVA